MKAETSLSTQHALSTQRSQSTPFSTAATSICRNCKCELPLELFYVNKTTLCPDKYCKECRKSISRKQYGNGKLSETALPDRLPYPVITQIEDREIRMQLIMHALQVVRLSIERKKTKMQEEESLL